MFCNLIIKQKFAAPAFHPHVTTRPEASPLMSLRFTSFYWLVSTITPAELVLLIPFAWTLSSRNGIAANDQALTTKQLFANQCPTS
jgi:hypothetical protein